MLISAITDLPLLGATTAGGTLPDWVTVLILGLLEGITEFIPVSSTGHLLLAEHWLPRQSELFNIVIQAAAVIAVLPLFRERLSQFIHRWKEAATQDYALKIATSFVMTGVGGLLLKRMGLKLPPEPMPVVIALFVGGVAFVAVERWLRGRPLSNQVTWSVAIVVGTAQLAAAAFPGLSRSGSTILLALALGLGRPAATEFSFLVGIPTMLAAGALEIYTALRHPPADAPSENWGMLTWGCLVSAVVSFIAVKWLLRYVQTHSFIAFGWYRIALSLLIFLALLA